MHICYALSLTPDLKASHQIKSNYERGYPFGCPLFIYGLLQALEIVKGLLAIAALVERFAGRRAKE